MGQDELTTTNMRLAAACSGAIHVAGRTPKIVWLLSGMSLWMSIGSEEHERFESIHFRMWLRPEFHSKG